jgi:hypothetical protein
MKKNDSHKIFGFKICGQQPKIGTILGILDYKPKVAVFEDIPIFTTEDGLNNEDFEYIQRNAVRIGEYGVIWHTDLIDKYIKKVAFYRNLIHFYENDLPKEYCKLKNYKWDFVYFCYDSSWVEIFSQNSKIAQVIHVKFDTSEILYPGSLLSPGGMDIDV